MFKTLSVAELIALRPAIDFGGLTNPPNTSDTEVVESVIEEQLKRAFQTIVNAICGECCHLHASAQLRGLQADMVVYWLHDDCVLEEKNPVWRKWKDAGATLKQLRADCKEFSKKTGVNGYAAPAVIVGDPGCNRVFTAETLADFTGDNNDCCRGGGWH